MSNNTNFTDYCNGTEDDVFDGSVESITFISNVTIGLIHLMITVFFIITQILIFISFQQMPKERYHNTPLPLMRHHGVVSFIQQLCHLVTSIKTIFLMRWEPIFIEIIGGILESAYLCGIAFILILSLNRCDLMYNFKFFPSVSRKKFYSIAAILCYVYFCLMMFFFLLPNNRMAFDIEYYEWAFVGDQCSAYYGFLIKKWAVYIPLIVSFILYVLTFYKIYYLRSLKQSSNYLYPEDIKIIINVIISYVLIITVEVCWHAQFFNIYETQLGALIPQIMYIIVSGANTTFTLFSVRDIRKNIFGRCCSKPIIQVSKLGNAQIKKLKVMF
uniref:7TM_GPCR_Srx domain-containing protein n=1 Tax=Strongyloides papillosus TaxID=174720 RepID=A0A0N5C296_STREA